MIIATLREAKPETRVAITPQAAKQYIKIGCDVVCEQGAGLLANFEDSMYDEAGAFIFKDRKAILQKAQVVVCVNEPTPKILLAFLLIVC